MWNVKRILFTNFPNWDWVIFEYASNEMKWNEMKWNEMNLRSHSVIFKMNNLFQEKLSPPPTFQDQFDEEVSCFCNNLGKE